MTQEKAATQPKRTKPPRPRVNIEGWAEKRGPYFARMLTTLTPGERLDVEAGLRAERDFEILRAQAARLKTLWIEAAQRVDAADKAIKRLGVLTMVLARRADVRATDEFAGGVDGSPGSAGTIIGAGGGGGVATPDGETIEEARDREHAGQEEDDEEET